MAIYYTRQNILQRLYAQNRKGKSFLMFGAGNGFSAKCAEAGNVDLIAIYTLAILRMKGIPSYMSMLPYYNTNKLLVEAANYILPIIKKTPCIAGVGAQDPFLNLNNFLDRLIDMGFSGIVNEPGVGGLNKDAELAYEKAGIGFSREVEMIRLAREKELFTIAWCQNTREAEKMTNAGADIIGAMILTNSNCNSILLPGEGKTNLIPINKAIDRVQKICSTARDIRKEVLIMTHGTPFMDIKSVKQSIQETDANGYASGSSGERIPAEKAIISITKKYRSICLNNNNLI